MMKHDIAVLDNIDYIIIIANLIFVVGDCREPTTLISTWLQITTWLQHFLWTKLAF